MKRGDTIAMIWIVLAATLLGGLAGHLSFVRVAENWVHDLRVALLTPSAPINEQIVIVSITEDTLAGLAYRSPVDRTFLAELLEALSAKGVHSIGVDIVFDQPTEPVKDERLRNTIINLARPVVVAWADRFDQVSEHQMTYLETFTAGMTRGYVRVLEDVDDAKVRSVYLGRSGLAEPSSLVSTLARLRDASIASEETLLLDFRLGPDRQTPPFATYAAHTVGFLPAPWFEGRTVLIGADLPHSDRHHTPLGVGSGRTSAGVELHAQALAQLLDHRAAPRASTGVGLFVIALFAFAAMLLAANVEAFLPRLGVASVLLVAAWGAIFAIYQPWKLSVPLVGPTLAFIVAGGLAHAFFRRRERAARRFIRGAFEKYLAPAYIEELVEHPERLTATAEQRVVTSLFTDIAGFTKLVDTLEPSRLASVLNDYLDQSMKLVLEMGGTIDKVVGDALHVMFNAPQLQSDHCERAVRCALALDEFSQHFVRIQREEGIEFGITRIGINTGTAIVGNFGGTARFDYTAHGTTINMAARLESANRLFATRVCASDAVRERCAHVRFRPIGDVVLIGLSEPVKLWEVLSDSQASSERVNAYRAAYDSLEKGESGAIETFQQLAERYPDDGLVQFQAERLRVDGAGTLIILKNK